MVKFAKGCLVVGLALAALCAGLPGILGRFIETNYQKLAQLQLPSNQWHVKIIHYHRHWLSSDVAIAITPADTAQAPIIVQQHIYHGPIMRIHTTQGYRYRFNFAYLIGTLAQHAKLNPVIRATWQFNQTIQAKLAIPALDYKYHGIQYQLSPTEGQATLDLGRQQLTLQLNGTQLTGTKNKITTILIKQWAVDNTYQQIKHRWQSRQTLRAQQLTMQLPHQPAIQLNGVKAAFKRYIARKTSDLSLHIQADHVRSTQNTPLSLTLRIDGANNKILDKINVLLATWQQSPPNVTELTHQGWPLFARLLQQGLTIKLNSLHIPTHSGIIQAQGQLTTPPTPHHLEWLSPITFFIALYQNFDANLQLTLPQPWLKDILLRYETQHWQQQHSTALKIAQSSIQQSVEKTLNQLRGDHILVETGHAYRLQLHLHQGQIRINDQSWT